MVRSIGEAIKRARVLKNLTQAELAGQLGVSRRTIGEWERTGKVPHVRVGPLSEILGDDFDTQLAEGVKGAEPLEFTYMGWQMTLHPNPGSTREEVAAVAPAIMTDVFKRIGEVMGTGTPVGIQAKENHDAQG